MRVCFFLVVFALSIFSTHAQSWYSSPVNNGRDVNTIKIFNRDTIVVAGGWLLADSTRSIFRTENGGLYMWNVPVDDNGHWIKSMDFTDLQNGIAVCTGGRILKTNDGGWHWTYHNAPLNRDMNRIFFIDTQNMIIAGGRQADSTQNSLQTILKSTDGGQSWNVALDQAGFEFRSVYFSTQTTGYAVGDSGTILKSIDGGDNWTAVNAPLQRNFNSVWFTDSLSGFIAGGYPTNDSITTILQTTDGGNNWTIKIDQLGGMLRDIHFANTNTGYAVGDSATVLKTTDGGQNWNPIAIPGTLGDEQFNTVRFYSEDFGYVSGKWGVQFIYNEEAAPEAFTSTVEIIDTLAFMHGLVNSHNATAAYRFVYSETSDFSSYYESGYAGLIESSTFSPVTEIVTDLLPDTTYYYLIKAWTLGGISYGDTLTFSTGSTTATLRTLDATNVSLTAATLHGSIRGYSNTVNLFFEYGTTPTFGNQAPATPASVNDTALQTFTASLSTLQPYTLYYYRVKGVSNGGNYYGDINFFFTGANSFYSAIFTLPATNVTDTSAVLNGFANGFKTPATIKFEYAVNHPNFNQPALFAAEITDSLPHGLTAPLFGLTPNTLHYFRTKAETPLGIFYGDTVAFYTLSQNPNVQTRTATQVTNSSAQLNGLLQKITVPIDSISFEYGDSIVLGSEVAATPLTVNDTLTHEISAPIGGLQDNTLYYYRLKATTTQGAKFYGEIKQLYTGAPTIPNWDFERWNSVTAPILKEWHMVGDNVKQVAGLSGNYALEIGSPGIVTLGAFVGFTPNGPLIFSQYMPYGYRPDSIVAWINCNLPAGDTLPMFVQFKSNDTVVGFQQCKIAGNTGGGFSRMAFPIQYMSLTTPDSIAMMLVCGLGYTLTIDDISFTPAASAPPPPNGDFERWFQHSYLDLESWKYLKYTVKDTATEEMAEIVHQTFYHPPNDYAVEITTIAAPNGYYLPGLIGTSSGFLGSPLPSFPVHAAHRTLNGYFQYHPVAGDSLEMRITLMKNAVAIGQASFVSGDTVTEFQPFEIPITYFNIDTGELAGAAPDSAVLSISCATGNVFGISRLIIDKLSFDGFRGDTDAVAVPPLYSIPQQLLLFPNPTNSMLTIELENEQHEKLQLEIFSMEGKRMYVNSFSVKRIEVPVADFPKGIYMVQVFSTERKVSGKFLVIK